MELLKDYFQKILFLGCAAAVSPLHAVVREQRSGSARVCERSAHEAKIEAPEQMLLSEWEPPAREAHEVAVSTIHEARAHEILANVMRAFPEVKMEHWDSPDTGEYGPSPAGSIHFFLVGATERTQACWLALRAALDDAFGYDDFF